REWAVEASTAPLPHGQYQPPAIWKVSSTGIHFSTEILQVPFHCSVVEWAEVESHLVLRCGNPAAQLEAWHQAFPATRLVAFSKVVMPDPHPQIRESDLQQRHDLIFGVIQFLHFAFACSEVFSAFAGHVGGLGRTFHSSSIRVF